MGLQIDDGTGKGGPLKIGRGNRAYTFSLIETPMESFGTEGYAYWIATDFISLTTTASYTGLIYLQNTHPSRRIHIAFWRQTTSVACLWRVIKNPTGGTLISAGTVVTPENSNFSSGLVAQAVCKKGADAQTVTGGSLLGTYGTGVYTPTFIPSDGAITLGTNNSIAIECKPTAAATVGLTLTVWFEEDEI